MKLQHIKKQLLTVALTTVAMGAMAQSLNSAYYTEDYKFRHDLNPAYGNDQNYISIPALGNVSVNTHGNFGYQDVVMNNPMYGVENGAKKMTTFMNPYISTSDALDGFSTGNNRITGDVNIALLSAGFKGFGGYNTIEVNAKTSFGIALPSSSLSLPRTQATTLMTSATSEHTPCRMANWLWVTPARSTRNCDLVPN